MENFNLKVEKVVGAASKDSACVVFRKNVQIGDNLSTLVSCFALSLNPEYDAQVILGDLFEITSGKFDEAAGAEGPLDILRAGANAIENYVSSKDLKVSFASLLFYEKACYFVRGGEAVKFYAFDPPAKLEISFKDGSGPIKDGQIYLLATEAFLSIFDVDELAGEGDVDLEVIIDGLATEISGEEKKSEIGAAFIQVTAAQGKERKPEDTAKEDLGDTSDGLETQDQETGDESPADVTENEEIAVAREEKEGGKKLPVYSERENPDIYARDESESAKRGRENHGLKAVGIYFSAFVHKFFKELGSVKRGDLRAVLRLRRNLILVAFVLILILAASGFFAYQSRVSVEKKKEAVSHLEKASTKYSEALAILGLNKSKAREILVDADKEIKIALSLDGKDEKASKLFADISGKLKETENLANVSFKTVLEKGENVVGLSITDKSLYAIYDKQIYSILFSGGKEVSEAVLDGVDKGLVFSGDAITASGGTIQKIKLAGGKKDKIGNVSGLLDIGIFVTNVYGLGADKIEKFVPVESGYVDAGNYLSGKMSFDQSSRMTIDGNIWVTSKDKIYKFLRGEKQNFEISGLVNTSSVFGEIYTSAEINNLYAVDLKNSALLVFGKDGVYKKAYQASEFAQVKGIAVNKDETKVYVGVGSKVLEASL